MAFDFKKEYKEFYMPAARPSIVTVPPMNYIVKISYDIYYYPEDHYDQDDTD
jgi:hypothetical protein